MSISANFPNVFPSLELNFANSQQLDPRVTFSRSTTAPYYNGSTVALAEQNLLTYSQNFSFAWPLSNVTQTANTVVAPDGTTTGTTLTDTAVTNTFNVQQNKPGTAGAYTGSMYFQAGTIGYAYVQVTDGTFRYTVLINLSTGAFATSSSTGSPTGTSYTITQVGSWWRLAVTVNLTGSTIYLLGGLSNTASPTFSFGNAQYTGTGTGTIYVWGAQLEQRSSVTAYNATTTTPITNYIPQLLTAPINAPRFDFNPVTGESLGLLIEQSSTNLLTYSQDFSNAVWTKAAASITSTANIAPDGTQTAQKLVESATSSAHYVTESQTPVSGTTYTLSTYIKAAGRNYAFLYIDSGFTNGAISVNLSTGAVTNSVFGTTTNGFSTSVGNGWYRVGFTVTATSLGVGSFAIFASTDGVWANRTYTGDGYSGIYIWGAQLEALAFPTSYTPTTSAQVTRAADNASMTGTNFSSWFNQGQGTFYSAGTRLSISGGNNPIFAVQNSSTTIFDLILGNTNTNFRYNSNIVIGSGISTGKISTSYNASTYVANASVNGSATSSSTATSAPVSCSSLQIGYSPFLANYFNGYISKLAYYPIAVSSTNIQALTGS